MYGCASLYAAALRKDTRISTPAQVGEDAFTDSCFREFPLLFFLGELLERQLRLWCARRSWSASSWVI